MDEEMAYELRWAKTAVGISLLIIGAITITIAIFGLDIPTHREKIDPIDLSTDFAEGRIIEVSPGKFEVYLSAGQFNFNPSRISLPAGSEVTFFVTSSDVIHGFQIVGTNVNMMALPGHVNSITYGFYEPGEYLYVCNEYCGQGHHVMSGTIIIED